MLAGPVQVGVVFFAAAVALSGCGDDGGKSASDDSDGPAEGTSPGECTDGADNDGDGDYDCNDADCSASPDCSEANTPGGCEDGLDNDGDTRVDCEDPDCDDDAACGGGGDGGGGDGGGGDGGGATDADGDGVPADEDCDDTDPSMPVDDADCDGALTADDCDDTDPDRYPGASEEGAALMEDPACDGGGGSLALADYQFVVGSGFESSTVRVASAGDVDGDGVPDLLIGASHDQGRAYVLLASSLGADSPIALAGAAAYTIAGEASVDRVGTSVSSAGDIDDDGLDDILVGANGASKAFVYLATTLADSGGEALPSYAAADYRFVGELAADGAGHDVAGAGDVDGDGRADFLVAALDGRVSLVLNRSLDTRGQWDADFGFSGGTAVANAGDVDGDGLNDILMGKSATGRAYLVLGRSLGEPGDFDVDADADTTFVNEAATVYPGSAVARAGDVDGDGLSDLLIGAYGEGGGGANPGLAYLVLGRSLTTGAGETFDLS